jgi:conjugative relaxase-like TrwC/TraI family protein
MGGLSAVLSLAKIGTRSHRYYTAQVACSPLEYYLGIGDERGRWHGRGLEALGLEPGAEAREPHLEALFGRAVHPVTGQRLGRAWRVDGVTGFDLTFSAPKSVSALWALGNPAIAGRVREAHRAAVAAALSYLDAHASWSRRGMDGTEQIATAGLVAAMFEHRTSRCADPQLHTHALVINKVLCADGRWRTLDATELYHHKKRAGTIYQAALRSELHANLGVVFEASNAHGQAEIAGIPQELLTLWSKRTAQIEPEAAAKVAELESALGRSLTDGERAAVTKAAVLKTRPAKSGTPSPTTLHDGWATEAKNAGHDPATVLAAVGEAAHPCGPTPHPGARSGWVAAAAVEAAAGGALDVLPCRCRHPGRSGGSTTTAADSSRRSGPPPPGWTGGPSSSSMRPRWPTPTTSTPSSPPRPATQPKSSWSATPPRSESSTAPAACSPPSSAPDTATNSEPSTDSPTTGKPPRPFNCVAATLRPSPPTGSRSGCTPALMSRPRSPPCTRTGSANAATRNPGKDPDNRTGNPTGNRVGKPNGNRISFLSRVGDRAI